MGSFHAYVLMLNLVYLVVGVKPYLRPRTPDSFLCQSRLFGRLLRGQLFPGRFQFPFGLICFFSCAFSVLSGFLPSERFSPSARLYRLGQARPLCHGVPCPPSPSAFSSRRIWLEGRGRSVSCRNFPEGFGPCWPEVAPACGGVSPSLKTQAAGRGGIRRRAGFLLRATLARGEGVRRRLFWPAFLWFFSHRSFLLSPEHKKASLNISVC